MKNSPRITRHSNRIGPVMTMIGLTTCGHLAAGTVLDYTPGTVAVQNRADGPFTVGSKFTVNTAGLTITQLGVMAIGGSGNTPNGFASTDGTGVMTGGFFTSPIAVGLWDATGTTLLANVSVTNASTFSDGYRYVTLTTPVTLTAGQSYLIGAEVGGGIQWFLDGGGVTPNQAPFSAGSSDFTLVSNQYHSGGSLAAPTTSDTSVIGRWGPANAIFVTAVPEPAAYGLLGAGMLAALTFVRRRRRG